MNTLHLLNKKCYQADSHQYYHQYGAGRLGAADWALTVWVTGHMGAGTNGHRRFGTRCFSTGQQTQVVFK